MKAVILAGGEGSRLRPVSSNRPKPMVRLFDRPVMEHLIALLRRNGITEICATLQYMPRMIQDYFGDGERFGVKMTYFVEREPLGTAGSVKNCSAFLGGSDFLVISGDGVCDFDLKGCAAFHKSAGAEATVVLYRHEKPLEYGLVMTGRDGRIQRFIEKPSWGQVFTNMINTGIYILSPSVLKEIPEGVRYDFARDLFPSLLARKRRLFGALAEGYWCDIGDCEAYLGCAADLLAGKMRWEPEGEKTGTGIWSESGLPEGVTLLPPCYIGKNAAVGPGSLIGPYTIIGEGSCVGESALVQRTVLDGGRVLDRATLYGAVVCRGAVIGRGAVLNEGAVIGEDSRIGTDAVVSERVRIWPNKELGDGMRATSNLVTGSLKHAVLFGEEAAIRGEINVDLTPEICVLLGTAAGMRGRTAVAWSGGEGARLAAETLTAGICSAGSEALVSDAVFEAAGAYIGETHDTPLSVFVRGAGNTVEFKFFNTDGFPLDREEQRKIESVVSRGEVTRADAGHIGKKRQVIRTEGLYASAAAGHAQWGSGRAEGLTVSVPGKGGSDRALEAALRNLGCFVTEPRKGVPEFSAGADGFHPRAKDEEGRELDERKLLALLCLLEMQSGDREIAVAPDAPAVLESIGRTMGVVVYRQGRDGKKADELMKKQKYLRDGVFGIARLAVHLARAGEPLSSLSRQIPKFHTRAKEVALAKNPGSVMQELAESFVSEEKELFDGLRVHTHSGWVRVTPLYGRRGLRIVGESAEEEIAEELCADFERRIKKIDGVSLRKD
ncbi:sugar phosphate nucleotidyltransferase [Papillibacter cinnamivorans]|uniref:Mannose-1-phosphate guanylyltransferase / phosphomannomutase n=1 Tax=Papillibacter cinnamivorans DSM 12816 TaxID=1122930 RepID=A0A1W2CZ54_9FIRM|nr:sugar phosphate nucleotidyltransferase [Papillibacter cinnamivorans]SMC90605.1 mannose-1-phosphate guanylyltransferase / phosphomannomutase [Papillibacter cinnamivorans DSM 12816]